MQIALGQEGKITDRKREKVSSWYTAGKEEMGNE